MFKPVVYCPGMCIQSKLTPGCYYFRLDIVQDEVLLVRLIQCCWWSLTYHSYFPHLLLLMYFYHQHQESPNRRVFHCFLIYHHPDVLVHGIVRGDKECQISPEIRVEQKVIIKTYVYEVILFSINFVLVISWKIIFS